MAHKVAIPEITSPDRSDQHCFLEGSMLPKAHGKLVRVENLHKGDCDHKQMDNCGRPFLQQTKWETKKKEITKERDQDERELPGNLS